MEKIINKGFGKGLKLSLGEFKGVKYLQIMELWKLNPKDDWKFSKKNVTINKRVLKEFIEFVKENEAELLKQIGDEPFVEKKEEGEKDD